jgi:hypothetical protein
MVTINLNIRRDNFAVYENGIRRRQDRATAP